MTRRKTNRLPRTLDQIGSDLSYAIQNRTTGMLRIGQLLNEAKELAQHGDWLPFLKLHRIEVRSAQRYMQAATWADSKCDTVSYFELSQIAPKAIYELASGKFSDAVVEQVISAAQYRHIGLNDVKEIAKIGEKAAILREIKAAQDAEDEAEKAEQAIRDWKTACDLATECECTVEAIDGGGYRVKKGDTSVAVVDLLHLLDWLRSETEKQRQERDGKSGDDGDDTEDTEDSDDAGDAEDGAEDDEDDEDDAADETPPAHLRAIAKFDEAVEMLRKIMTKSLAIFEATKTPTDVVDEVSRFLDEVSHRRKLKLHSLSDAPIDASKLN